MTKAAESVAGQFAGCCQVSKSGQCSWERLCLALCWTLRARGGQCRGAADHYALTVLRARGGWGGGSTVGLMLPVLVGRSMVM